VIICRIIHKTFSGSAAPENRRAGIEIVTGAELKPVVTDNFVLVCPPGKVQKDRKVVIAYKGKPVTRPDKSVLDQLTNARKIAAEYPNGGGGPSSNGAGGRESTVAAVHAWRGAQGASAGAFVPAGEHDHGGHAGRDLTA
jgi:hypothetical protein